MKIFISKFELDAAYRCCQLSGATAAESLTIHNNTLLMALQMTFGVAPCPSMCGYISDTIADICNTLIHYEKRDHTSLFDNISNTLPPPSSLPPDIPFHPARELSIIIPPYNLGKMDVTPNIADNASRISTAVPLAIHTLARPLNPSDEIPRVDIISSNKTHCQRPA
jgi:hypothetical protein